MSTGKSGSLPTRDLPLSLRRGIRRIARWAAQIRNTRAWPWFRPGYNFVKRFVDVEGILGPSGIRIAESREANRATELDAKLWGGFSRYALRDLESLRRSRFALPAEQSIAAWALARWYALQQDYERALDYVVFMRAVGSRESKRKGQVLLEVDCLIQLGYPDEARAILDHELERRGNDPDLCLSYANTYVETGDSHPTPDDDDQRLAWINRVFASAGFAPIQKTDPERPLTIDNIAAPIANRQDDGNLPKISVIVPAYNAQATIEVALGSVLGQTWPNLEVIVVDDCSTDGTPDLIRQATRSDSRIISVFHNQNQGVYAARNSGLLHATGDFITTHDSDDWSHPQKLEAQARALMAELDMAATMSYFARVNKNLKFTREWRPADRNIRYSSSSLMLASTTMARLGRWDRVRVSADTELILRLSAILGEHALLNVHSSVPLSFSLDEGASLTRHTATHSKTIFFGLRREYHEAAAWWRQSVPDKSALRLDPHSTSRPFPAPGLMLSERLAPKTYDILVISDLAMTDWPFRSTYDYILAGIHCNRSVAAFHWRQYELANATQVNHKVRSLAHEQLIDIVVAGQELFANTIIATYPVALRHLLDDFPNVRFKHLVVVVGQTAHPLYAGGDVQYDPREIRGNLVGVFGTEGKWAPVSNLVRHLMEQDERYPKPHHENWTPLIDKDTWMRKPLTWRGDSRQYPCVGRHCSAHYAAWPSNAQKLRSAYLAERRCEVRFLGGAEQATQVIGSIPSNWKVFAFDSIDVPDFLRDLDFFIHFPHEDSIEECGRCVIESMAAGCPAILAPIFKDTFGDAAVYCEPEEVWGHIESLWRNEGEYLRQAQKGQEFVQANCPLELLSERLARLIVDNPRITNADKR
jgi:glycosyltransferase involved in cell wall biosynthesis